MALRSLPLSPLSLYMQAASPVYLSAGLHLWPELRVLLLKSSYISIRKWYSKVKTKDLHNLDGPISREASYKNQDLSDFARGKAVSWQKKGFLM